MTDAEFEEAFVKKPLYRTRDVGFTRMVLIEIDRSLHSSGRTPDYSALQSIELIIPEKLDVGWRTSLGWDARDEELAIAKHSIGNLCLLPSPVKKLPGGDPFEAKKSVLSTNGALARQIKSHPGPWNIEAIKERSAKLARSAIEIWKWGKN